MLLVQVQPHHHPFVVQWLLEPSIQMCCTSCLCHGNSQLSPPIPVVSIWKVVSAVAESSAYAVVPLCRLCPSPSRIHHIRSACPALSLHHAHLSHHPHLRNMQDRSDCLGYPQSSPQTSFRALWLSIPRFLLSLCIPAPACSLPLHLQLGFLPERFLSQHNRRFISLCLHLLWSAFLVVCRPHTPCWLQAARCPKGSDCFCFEAALAFIRLMRSLGGPLCRFAVIARRKWLKFRSEHWPL